MAIILVALPARDFDPTEAGVPWKYLAHLGHQFVFATPDGKPATADPMMVTGERLGILSPLLRANTDGRNAYAEMIASSEFQHPIGWSSIRTKSFDAIILPGGHAKGMRPYLESTLLQARLLEFFQANKIVGAICHGVVLAARTKLADGDSILRGRKTTALTAMMELSAWRMTSFYLGDYYRTYPETVEDEVRHALTTPKDFISGPVSLTRDRAGNTSIGFVVRDGNYLSARWPGDAHRFAETLHAMLSERTSLMLEISHQFPNDADGDVLRSLVERGVDLTKPRIIDFYCYARDELTAQSIVDDLTQLGYACRISLDEETEEPEERQSVYASRSIVPSYKTVIEIQSELDLLLRRYETVCDGWGTLVDPSDPNPKL